jgi:DNA-binding protein H-NS
MYDAIKKEYEKVWKSDTKMVDFCVKKTIGIVQLEDGGYFCFEKPSIETHFCFGYGQNGISTEEDYNDAVKAKINASTKEYFFKENMRKFQDLENMLKYDGKVYSMELYNSKSKLRGLKTDEEERRFGKMYGTIISEITPIDRLNLKIELSNQKKKFEKRLETYWKKYGSSKFKTWTYLVD